LIGHPVAHSISPAFQQAAFDHCGLQARYDLWDTPEDELVARISGLREPRILGANVTIPHKQQVLRMVDSVDQTVDLAGAANTIVNRSGHLEAFNTDVGGFARALAAGLGYNPTGRRAVLLGAGGTARAVIAALAAEGAESILVLNRSTERARNLVDEFAGRVRPQLESGPLDEGVQARIRDRNLVINCTSVGLAGSPLAGQAPIAVDALPPGAVVVDVIANPVETPLLAAARRRGHTTLGGLPMLVHQGALSFQLWTGLEPPLDIMTHAAQLAMRPD
jgi:shikimate dehydrogenase